MAVNSTDSATSRTDKELQGRNQTQQGGSKVDSQQVDGAENTVNTMRDNKQAQTNTVQGAQATSSTDERNKTS